jgi:hypothetical protein
MEAASIEQMSGPSTDITIHIHHNLISHIFTDKSCREQCLIRDSYPMHMQ